MKNVIKRIQEDKNLVKSIERVNYYEIERFISDAKRYISAIRQGRVICSIGSVSKSGMSRTIKFLAPEKNEGLKRYQYYNFFALFKALGYSPVNESDYFRIHGCGMDMVFHTNYSNIHTFERLGFISKKECSKLAQMTPTVI